MARNDTELNIDELMGDVQEPQLIDDTQKGLSEELQLMGDELYNLAEEPEVDMLAEADLSEINMDELEGLPGDPEPLLTPEQLLAQEGAARAEAYESAERLDIARAGTPGAAAKERGEDLTNELAAADRSYVARYEVMVASAQEAITDTLDGKEFQMALGSLTRLGNTLAEDDPNKNEALERAQQRLYDSLFAVTGEKGPNGEILREAVPSQAALADMMAYAENQYGLTVQVQQDGKPVVNENAPDRELSTVEVNERQALKDNLAAVATVDMTVEKVESIQREHASAVQNLIQERQNDIQGIMADAMANLDPQSRQRLSGEIEFAMTAVMESTHSSEKQELMKGEIIRVATNHFAGKEHVSAAEAATFRNQTLENFGLNKPASLKDAMVEVEDRLGIEIGSTDQKVKGMGLQVTVLESDGNNMTVSFKGYGRTKDGKVQDFNEEVTMQTAGGGLDMSGLDNKRISLASEKDVDSRVAVLGMNDSGPDLDFKASQVAGKTIRTKAGQIKTVSHNVYNEELGTAANIVVVNGERDTMQNLAKVQYRGAEALAFTDLKEKAREQERMTQLAKATGVSEDVMAKTKEEALAAVKDMQGQYAINVGNLGGGREVAAIGPGAAGRSQEAGIT